MIFDTFSSIIILLNDFTLKLLASVVKSSVFTLKNPVFSFVSVLKEPNKDIQQLLKPSSSGSLSKEVFHSPAEVEEEAEGGLPGHTASLLHIAEKRREYPEEVKGH